MVITDCRKRVVPDLLVWGKDVHSPFVVSWMFFKENKSHPRRYQYPTLLRIMESKRRTWKMKRVFKPREKSGRSHT